MRDIRIRRETDEDIPGIYRLNAAAFETDAEALLVNRLRKKQGFFLSVVAEHDNKIVGHILFTAVSVERNSHKIKTAGLAPMAVSPNLQNKGIGSTLVKRGLSLCRQSGYEIVFVLGHETYYPRFGFNLARAHDMYYQNENFDPYFFVIAVDERNLDDLSGEIQFDPEFEGV